MAQDPSERIQSTCRCGARFRVSADAVGKKAKCPKCGESFTIRAPAEVPAPTTPNAGSAPLTKVGVQPKSRDAAPSKPEAREMMAPDSLLDDLARMEQKAPSIGRSAPPQTCAKCGQILQPGAKVCMGCGYNALTGKVMRSATVRQVQVAEAVSAGKRFALGVVCCGGVALVSAAIWFYIAMATFRESAWIAWLLVLACGWAMLKGWGKASPAGGIIAASISVGGILLAKALIFGFLVYAAITGDTENIHVQRLVVAELLTERQLDQEGIFELSKREKRYDEIHPQSELRVRLMSEEKVREMVQELRDEYAATSAIEDPVGRKRYRLAWHAADRRLEQLFLPEFDPRRQDFVKEEIRRLKELPEAELDAAIAQLEAWEKGGRWDDEAHIRNVCIRGIVTSGMEAREAAIRAGALSNEELERAAWKEALARGESECDQKTHEQRAADLRAVERAVEREEMIGRLAYHRAERRADRAGLPQYDDRREEYYDEEQSNLADIDDESLAQDITALDTWEDAGRWDDESYVRDLVAYHHANVNTQEVMAPRWADDDDDNDELSDEEWQQAYAEGLRKADALSPEERLALATKIDSGEIDLATETTEDNATAEAIGLLIGAYFAWVLRPFSLLVFALAIASAYKVASSGITQNA